MLTLHPDGTGSLIRPSDGRRIRRLSEAETRALLGGPVVDGVKASAKDPPRTGTLTVTAVDRAAGAVTVSALHVPPSKPALSIDKSVRSAVKVPKRPPRRGR